MTGPPDRLSPLEATVVMIQDEPRWWTCLPSGLLRLLAPETRRGHDPLAKLDADVAVPLIDRWMPDLFGDEVRERIRVADSGCLVGIVSEVDPTVDVIELDVDEYLTTPVSGEKRCRTVQQSCTQATDEEWPPRYFA